MLSTIVVTLLTLGLPAAVDDEPLHPVPTSLETADDTETLAQRRRPRRRPPRPGGGGGSKAPAGPPAGVDPLTMTGMQIGVGAGTLAACSALSCASFLCVYTGGVLPVLTGCGLGCVAAPLVFAHCTLAGAAAGATEGLVANWFGQQRSPLLYTSIAGASTGAAFGALAGGFWLSALAANQGHVEGGAVFEPLPFVDADPFARNLTIATFVALGLGALAAPVVPAVVYALFAKNARAGEPPRLLGDNSLPSREDPLDRAPPRVASRMAY